MYAKTKRNEEAKRLRYEEGMKLEEIGEVLGISRERVSQIVGKAGYDFRTKWTKKKVKELFHIDPYASVGVASVWQKARASTHHRVRGRSAKYEKFERLASEILNRNGIKNKLMPFLHPFDIELEDGTRVDVKYAGSWTAPSLKGDNLRRAAHTKGGKDCDFFFVLISEEVYFVIPANIVPKHHIVFPWPPHKDKRYESKYHQYYRRIDLLKGGE